MRFRFLFGVVCIAALMALPGTAAQAAPVGGKPVLRAALIDITPEPSQQTATVRESLTVGGVPSGMPVKQILALFPGVQITGLRVMVGSSTMPVATTAGDHAQTIAFTAPHGDTLQYDVSYTVVQGGNAPQVPILVPSYPSDGSRVVRLRYHVPDGYHIQGEPFPIVVGSTGTQQRDLIGVPSFLSYQLGSQPSSGWSIFSWLGVVIIVIGVAMSAVVLVREARSESR